MAKRTKWGLVTVRRQTPFTRVDETTSQMIEFCIFLARFFKSPRRRIGLMSLTVAVLVMIRSLFHSSTQPFVSAEICGSLHSVGYTAIGLAWVIDEGPFYMTTEDAERCRWDHDWGLCGFRLAERHLLHSTKTGIVNTRSIFLTVPYWSIASYLALVTVWLLNSTPRSTSHVTSHTPPNLIPK